MKAWWLRVFDLRDRDRNGIDRSGGDARDEGWERWLGVVAGGVMVVVVAGLWSATAFIWVEPSAWWIVAAVLVLAAGGRRLPVVAVLWWSVGTASLLWTLTPGTTWMAVLWTVLYLAVWGIGYRPALLVATAWVLLQGVFSTVSLQAFGMAQYFSGSINYLTGAVALILVPWMTATAVRAEARAVRVGAVLLGGVAAYGALSSGARAVYLPLLIVVPLTLGRLALDRARRRRIATAAAGMLVIVVLGNLVVPGRPVTSALGIKARATTAALASAQAPRQGAAASTTKEPAPIAVENGVASRLQMWDQTFRIGLSHPLGTGLGSFRDTIVAFQRYPTVNFASAHDVFLEVFATEGWLGLGLLLLVLGMSVVRGWRDPRRWPIALGAAAIWLSMGFDITWSLPVIPVLGFWALSEAYGSDRTYRSRLDRRARASFGIAVPVLATVLALWWFVPCGGPRCVLARHLGYRPEAFQVVQDATATERTALLSRLRALNPKSVWVLYLARDVAGTPEQRLEVDRAIVTEFPLASPNVYLELARLEAGQGNRTAARDVLQKALRVFPPDLSPAGVPLVSRSKEYSTWIEDARALLATLSD